MTLEGKRILVVEDSPVVAPYTQDVLSDLGCIVVGPAVTMAAARQLAESEELDAAIMDIHIRGDRVFAICELLESRGVPFLLTSGYGDRHTPEKWRRSPCLPKPYTLEQVERALGEIIGDRASA